MTGIALHFLIGVAVVGSMLWGVARLAERWKTAAPRAAHDEPLRVVARRNLAKGVSVVRLSVEDRDILVGATPKGVELICELPKTDAPAATRARAAGPLPTYGPDGQPLRPAFAEILTRSLALGRRRS